MELKRSLRLFDGLAMVVGVVVGAGILRTPGLIAGQLGRPWLTFVAWVLGGALAFLGALIFAELATRLPRAGGKYVYAPAMSCRIKPARSIHWWLGISASAGTSFKVGINVLVQRTKASLSGNSGAETPR